jgi:hypothetical protein
VAQFLAGIGSVRLAEIGILYFTAYRPRKQVASAYFFGLIEKVISTLWTSLAEVNFSKPEVEVTLSEG